MMIMSTPSSSYHNYLTIDKSLTKIESLSPIQINEDHSEELFENKNKNSKNSTVKRPMNAFLLWARGERKRVSSDGYGVSQTSLSKFLGETWRQMTVEEKQPFLDMAETLKKQHHIDHPAYRFKAKQRSPTANKAIVKKQNSPISEQHLSTMYPTSSLTLVSQKQQTTTASTSNAAPLPIQSTVIAMCQAIIPSSSSSNNNNDWFSKLINQPQPVIVAPAPRIQTSPITSRRAVRIQIINKHDDIPLNAPTLLPMTPSPSSIAIDDSTPTLIDYLTNTSTLFNMPNIQQGLAPVTDDENGFETLQNSTNNHLMDLDQPYNGSGWIDTPLSSFGTNAVDLLSTSPYSTYDFLCL